MSNEPVQIIHITCPSTRRWVTQSKKDAHPPKYDYQIDYTGYGSRREEKINILDVIREFRDTPDRAKKMALRELKEILTKASTQDE